jgi:uncharacterized protein (DUF433 family)
MLPLCFLGVWLLVFRACFAPSEIGEWKFGSGNFPTRRQAAAVNRITINPNQCGGRPCIRGMRIRVKDVLDMLADGATSEEILADFPDLEAADIHACIA